MVMMPGCVESIPGGVTASPLVAATYEVWAGTGATSAAMVIVTAKENTSPVYFILKPSQNCANTHVLRLAQVIRCTWLAELWTIPTDTQWPDFRPAARRRQVTKGARQGLQLRRRSWLLALGSLFPSGRYLRIQHQSKMAAHQQSK